MELLCCLKHRDGVSHRIECVADPDHPGRWQIDPLTGEAGVAATLSVWTDSSRLRIEEWHVYEGEAASILGGSCTEDDPLTVELHFPPEPDAETDVEIIGMPGPVRLFLRLHSIEGAGRRRHARGGVPGDRVTSLGTTPRSSAGRLVSNYPRRRSGSMRRGGRKV